RVSRSSESALKREGTHQPRWLRSYNGGMTGPTLRVKAGDTLNVLLKNDLPEERPMDMAMEGSSSSRMHGFNTTTLQPHGLHISPSGNSDNVLLSLPPTQ